MTFPQQRANLRSRASFNPLPNFSWLLKKEQKQQKSETRRTDRNPNRTLRRISSCSKGILEKENTEQIIEDSNFHLWASELEGVDEINEIFVPKDGAKQKEKKDSKEGKAKAAKQVKPAKDKAPAKTAPNAKKPGDEKKKTIPLSMAVPKLLLINGVLH